MSNPIDNTLDETSVPPEAQPAHPPATPLLAALGNPSIPAANYRGVQVAKSFSGAREELAALLTGAGVYDLGWRGFLRCAGRDRVRWLNGMVTNSVKDLEENAGCYAFVLNAQGRIQGDLDIYRPAHQPDALWIETDRNQIEPLLAFLRHYIIMDQVKLEHQTEWTALGIAGPAAAKKIAALGISVAEMSPMHLSESNWQGSQIFAVAAYSPRVPRYEIWIETNAVLDLWNALNAAGCIPCGAEAVEQLRILEGTPAYGIDIADRDLPQETNQMRALNFTKGCYLGQEIVERIRSRGNVHRTLSGFVLEREPSPVEKSLHADGKPVGDITSFARIALPEIGEQVLTLGRIRREALESKITTSGGIPAAPSALPFDFAGTAVQP